MKPSLITVIAIATLSTASLALAEGATYNADQIGRAHV